MEDAHTAVLDLDDGTEGEKNAFFAVYDDHGGTEASTYAGANVHKRLVSEDTYRTKEYEAALKSAFLGADDDLRQVLDGNCDSSACTAVAAFISHDGTIYVANAGDSRSVLSTNGNCKALSTDHKPEDPAETVRITAAGGYIERGRVNDALALSRGLGDFRFKNNKELPPEKQIVTANPDITRHEITDEDEFLVLACDGIWDCLRLNKSSISSGTRCPWPESNDGYRMGEDNMTIALVAFLHGRTEKEWYAWIEGGVRSGYEMPVLYSKASRERFRIRKENEERRRKEEENREAIVDNGSGDERKGESDAGGGKIAKVPWLMEWLKRVVRRLFKWVTTTKDDGDFGGGNGGVESGGVDDSDDESADDCEDADDSKEIDDPKKRDKDPD